MAERRMFAKAIIDSDAFLDMPLSTQALYFHLSMRADDDGFVNNPFKILRMINATKNDHDLLIVKGFVIPFESGVCVIKHWRIHNYLRSDRYKPTAYQDEKANLCIKENGVYSFGIPTVNQMETKCLPLVDAGKDRLGKDRLGKGNSNGEQTAEHPPIRFQKPTMEEVEAYCKERNNKVNPERFYDFYESKGWYVGKNKMKDWRACVRTWEMEESQKKQSFIDAGKHEYTSEQFEAMFTDLSDIDAIEV